jgi:hypothetical protein
MGGTRRQSNLWLVSEQYHPCDIPAHRVRRMAVEIARLVRYSLARPMISIPGCTSRNMTPYHRQPRLIHSETKQQSAADVEFVQDVVKSYTKEPRSIILTVVSAKNNYANQIVL